MVLELCKIKAKNGGPVARWQPEKWQKVLLKFDKLKVECKELNRRGVSRINEVIEANNEGRCSLYALDAVHKVMAMEGVDTSSSSNKEIILEALEAAFEAEIKDTKSAVYHAAFMSVANHQNATS